MRIFCGPNTSPHSPWSSHVSWRQEKSGQGMWDDNRTQISFEDRKLDPRHDLWATSVTECSSARKEIMLLSNIERMSLFSMRGVNMARTLGLEMAQCVSFMWQQRSMELKTLSHPPYALQSPSSVSFSPRAARSQRCALSIGVPQCLAVCVRHSFRNCYNGFLT